MNQKARQVRGSVRTIACKSCAVDFPVFDYEVESDAAEIGLYSAGICGEKKLMLLELDIHEWRDACSGRLRKIPSRFSRDIVCGDYRLTHVLRVERAPEPPAGLSFAEFRQRYVAPTVVYACPGCGAGEAVTQSELEMDEYIERGGLIAALPPLALLAR